MRRFVTHASIVSVLAGLVLFGSHFAQAAGICEALKQEDDAAVHVTGRIVDMDAEAGMMEIEDDCDSILIMTPGNSPEEVLNALENCAIGGTAEVLGTYFLLSVEANALLCE